jgi:thiol:disulfide interchange protein DsbC
MSPIKIIFFAFTLLLSPTLFAAESEGLVKSPVPSASLSAEDVRARLLQARPELPILSVEASTLAGFWDVKLPGGQTLFVSASGKHFVVGELFEITDNNFVNISEQGRNGERKQLLAIDKKDMVIFKATTGEPKAVINVFTDIDCGYCRKLHEEVPEMNRLGIEVRYLAYPRAGIGSASYDKLVSAWCSDNPQMALTLAKGGSDLPVRTCANAVAAEYQLGGAMGVTGTPSLVFEDGRMQAGYIPVAQLAVVLGLN